VSDNQAYEGKSDQEEPLTELRAKARLRQAVWEASQFLSTDHVMVYIEGVLQEIDSDAVHRVPPPHFLEDYGGREGGYRA